MIKLLILGLIILLLGLYFHIIIKKETFGSAVDSIEIREELPGTDVIILDGVNNADKLSVSDLPTLTISTELISQIANKLNISIRRIQNLIYNGDLSKQHLAVSFTILDPNIIEANKGETNAQTAADTANTLFMQNAFTVKINNINIMLSKINNTSTDSKTSSKTSTSNTPYATVNMSTYFNNTSLQDISKYALQTYREVPNDASLTNFYSLKIDNNYNINPVLDTN